ncbi:MAG: hypothetical protein RJS97_08725 [Parvibaculaceae bacterium]
MVTLSLVGGESSSGLATDSGGFGEEEVPLAGRERSRRMAVANRRPTSRVRWSSVMSSALRMDAMETPFLAGRQLPFLNTCGGMTN